MTGRQQTFDENALSDLESVGHTPEAFYNGYITQNLCAFPNVGRFRQIYLETLCKTKYANLGLCFAHSFSNMFKNYVLFLENNIF